MQEPELSDPWSLIKRPNVQAIECFIYISYEGNSTGQLVVTFKLQGIGHRLTENLEYNEQIRLLGSITQNLLGLYASREGGMDAKFSVFLFLRWAR